MPNYVIRRAVYSDLEIIEEIYEYARTYMREHGNPTQWGTQNPSHEMLLEDVQQEQLYVITECGHICGVFAFVVRNDATYAVIDGKWNHTDPYGTIHRLAGIGTGGIFNACLTYCLTQHSYIRIDTHENNHIMQHLIGKAGFSRCGIIRISDGSPRIAYDLKKT